MLRVTPIYGSRYDKYGQAEEPNCTLIEFSGCRVLVNVGWWGYRHHHHSTTTSNNANNNNNNKAEVDNNNNTNEQLLQYNNNNTTNYSTFPYHLIPDHDCLVLTDSTIESIGGLPMYYKEMRRRQQQRMDKKLQLLSRRQQQQRRRSSTNSRQQQNNNNRLLDENSNRSIRSFSSTNNNNDNDVVDDNYYDDDDDNDNDNNNNASHTTTTNLPPIYATYPTVKMGQMTLYDQHACICLDGGYPPYTLEDVDDACSSIHSIKYSQSMYIPSPVSNKTQQQSSAIVQPYPDILKKALLSITGYRAGHVVGGAFYVLQRLQDETIVVITNASYHIAKEKHLDSSTLLQHGSTPDVLITRPGGPALRLLKSLAHPTTHQQRKSEDTEDSKKSKITSTTFIPLPPILVAQAQRQLIELIMSVLRREGNVLLPVDASGRVLEMLLLLNEYWETQRLQTTYNLIWCSHMCENTIQYARSQLEWMSNALGQEFEGGGGSSSFNNPAGTVGSKGGGGGAGSMIRGGHPFQLRSVRLCTSVQQLDALIEEIGGNTNAAAGGGESNQNPTCVLASGLSLEGGPARDIFLKWADNPDNAVIFTDSSQCYLRSSVGGGNSSVIRRTSSIKRMSSTAIEMETNVNEASGEFSSIAGGIKNESTHSRTREEQHELDKRRSSTVSIAPQEDDEEEESGTRTGMMALAAAAGDVTHDPSEWTTAGQLLKAWAKAKATGSEMDDSIMVDVPVPFKAALAGAELKAFLAAEEAARLHMKAEEEKRAMLREVELAKGQLRLGEEDGGGTALTTNAVVPAIIANDQQIKQQEQVTAKSSQVATRPRKKSRFDSTLFLKFSKPLHLTFEVREESAGIGQPDYTVKFGIGETVGRPGDILEDDYGIAVQPERFTDIVSGVDPSKFAGGSGRIGDEVLKRGFGYGVSDNPSGGTKSKLPSKRKSKAGLSGSRIVSEDEDQDDDDDDFDEREMEAMDLSEGTGIIRGRNGRQPMKVSIVHRQIEVLAEISYIPGLEGRVDARAARQSVRALQPREVIVLGGTKGNTIYTSDMDEDSIPIVTDEAALLAEAAKSFANGSKEILTPSDGELAELEIGHAAYSVRLIDIPYETKEEKEKPGYEPPEPIEPFETKLGACAVSLLDCVATGQKVALDGSIVLAPKKQSIPVDGTSADITKCSPSVYVSDGEVLLTDLRAELIAQGMKAEYTAHTGYSQLVVNGKITVRKEHDQEVGDVGNISVEGPLCEDFYIVRTVVCGQFVVL